MHNSKLINDFNGAYLVSTLNPNNKTWQQQLNQIYQILENCHININSSYIKPLIKSWYIDKQKKSCPGYWTMCADNYHFETQFEKTWNS